jgi:hypothetical protein
MSSLLTEFVKCPEPTTIKLIPLNHQFLTTINYNPRKYTYQNLHTATRKVSDAGKGRFL